MDSSIGQKGPYMWYWSFLDVQACTSMHINIVFFKIVTHALEKKILGQLRLGESPTSCPAVNYIKYVDRLKQKKIASPLKVYSMMLLFWSLMAFFKIRSSSIVPPQRLTSLGIYCTAWIEVKNITRSKSFFFRCNHLLLWQPFLCQGLDDHAT